MLERESRSSGSVIDLLTVRCNVLLVGVCKRSVKQVVVHVPCQFEPTMSINKKICYSDLFNHSDVPDIAYGSRKITNALVYNQACAQD